MISIYEEKQDFPFIGEIKVACLSTDTFPTVGIDTGEKLLEIDSGNIYIFDALEGAWKIFLGEVAG